MYLFMKMFAYLLKSYHQMGIAILLIRSCLDAMERESKFE